MARLRFAWRSLAKAPLLSLVVVLSVGLGIGANTAIFSLFHQILLNSLPVERPEELVAVTSPGKLQRRAQLHERRRRHGFHLQLPDVPGTGEASAGDERDRRIPHAGANLSFRKQTISGTMLIVSGGYFPTLGVRPLMGRC